MTRMLIIPGGSKATIFAELGPKSMVFCGAMALTSHKITVPCESHEAIVSP